MVDINYRTNDPDRWGNGIGRRLTGREADLNFWGLVSALQGLLDHGGAGTTVTDLIIQNDQLSIALSDHTVIGPVTLPTASIRWQGEWAANFGYTINDLFSQNGRVFIVLQSHTSGTTFDMGATDGNGHDLYALILPNRAVPFFEIATATWTPTLPYANTYMRMTYPAGCDVSVDGSIFPLGTELYFRDASLSGGSLIVVGISPTEIDWPGGNIGIANEHGLIGMKKISTEHWDGWGSLVIA